MPDYYNAVAADDKDRCNLITDLGKWNQDGTIGEDRHHCIFGLRIHPDVSKTLQSVTVKKTAANGIVTFYGATGVMADPPPSDKP